MPRAGIPSDQELKAIEGEPPDFARLPDGCAFHPRCRLTRDRSVCRRVVPALSEVAPGHASACHFADELTAHLFQPREQPAI
jgi:oligopeptide/dipeptide ABC transporter ATP-binding protein